MTSKITVIKKPNPVKPLTAEDLVIGGIGIMTDGEYIMRTYDEYVQLDNPINTWGLSAKLSLREILSDGDTITLTLKGSKVKGYDQDRT